MIIYNLKNKYYDFFMNKISDLLFSVLITIVLCISIIEPLGLDYKFGNILLPVLIVNFFIFVLILDKKYLLRAIAIIFIGIVFFFLYAFLSGSINEIMSTVLIYFNQIIDTVFYGASPDEKIAGAIVVLISIAISIPVFILTTIKLRFPILLISSASMYIIQVLFRIKSDYFAFYAFIILMLVLYCRWIFIKKQELEIENQNKNIKFIILAIPVCLIIFALTYWVPKSDEPLELRFEQSGSYSGFFNFNNISRPRNFSISYSGFSSNSSYLGGEVRLDNKHVLNVYSTNRSYLTGAIRDIYTGYSWESSKDNFIFLSDSGGFTFDLEGKRPENFIKEIIEPAAIIPFMGRDFNTDELYIENTMNIEYININTNTLFRPSKFYSLKFFQDQGDDIFFDYYSSLRTENALSRGLRYRTNYLLFNNFNDELENIIRKSKKGIYSEIFNLSDFDIFYKRTVKLTNEIEININYETIKRLQNYSENIYKKYLQIPANLPSRVENLALSITNQFDNNYDKAKAVENYLSSNFNYTLTPVDTPKEYEFVDYFLFEGKEGYCVYYATAMTVMMRTLGIPARYVEGYKLPSRSYLTPDGLPTDIYIVTNENAHAWTELYFEGFGWIPFEPTAAFTDEFYRYRETKVNLDSNFDFSDFDELQDDTIYITMNFLDSFKIIISILMTLLIVFVIYNIYKTKRKFNIIEANTPVDTIKYIMVYVNKLLKELNISKMEYETYNEYLERIKSRPDLFEKDGFFKFYNFLECILEIYTLSLYSNIEISKTQSDIAIINYKGFVSEIKTELGSFRYLVYKYLLGKF